MDRSQHLESSAPESVMIGDYQLALKIFMNKDIPRSFAMLRKLQPAAFRSFSRGVVSEELYSKITTLYLTEVGLLLNPPSAKDTSTLLPFEKQGLILDLRKNVILDQFAHLYGAVADAPSELIFHVFLVYYTCKDVIEAESDDFVLSKFKLTYHALDFQGRENDRHLKRFFDMFVLNVLPESGDFVTAFAISESNRTFGGESTTAKLKEIEQVKTQENLAKQKQKKEIQAREAKRIAAEKEEAKKKARENDLKYRSLKQIKADQERRDLSRNGHLDKEVSPGSPTLDRVKQRLAHFLAISRNTLNEKSPVILAVILFLFISGQILRRKKINVRQKLKETLSMAFKVTYL